MATFEDFFGSRKWRVATEVTGVVGDDKDGSVTTFDQGRFEIDGGTFHSPFSSARGRRGVLLQEVGPDGSDLDGRDSRIAVGITVLRRARKAGAVA